MNQFRLDLDASAMLNDKTTLTRYCMVIRLRACHR